VKKMASAMESSTFGDSGPPKPWAAMAHHQRQSVPLDIRSRIPKLTGISNVSTKIYIINNFSCFLFRAKQPYKERKNGHYPTPHAYQYSSLFNHKKS
jgi:hypothetical protein